MFNRTKRPAPESMNASFRLPITYQPPDTVHAISETVIADLEMNDGMTAHLLRPEHEFASQLLVANNKQITSHIPFLRDTQTILSTVRPGLGGTNCETMKEIWKDIKLETNFLEKYSFVDWDILKHFNKSPMFLQVMAIVNMGAPVMSFIVPFLFFVFPFLLLKLQGIPITFATYLDVLKDIARHHFIGTMINSLQSISWEKVIYMCVMTGLYGLQIYQNVNICRRFYANITRVNSHLCHMKDYLDYSIANMAGFVDAHRDLETYAEFCEVSDEHTEVLRGMRAELDAIKPFTPGFSKITEIGYLWKCFYELHDNSEYERSWQYSIGFEGYYNNLMGIASRIDGGEVAFAIFDADADTKITAQYYPAYVGEKHTKNNLDLATNAIITGPNAAGKTTILKTTALNVIMTQQLGVGFYKACVLNPYTHIHSYLNIPDTSGRDSLFQAESRRCKEIIDAVDEKGGRHFCMFDELYSGTNPSEATKSAVALLQFLSKRDNVDFMLTTHYTGICKKMRENPRISNYKMEVIEQPLKYTYRMKHGISKIKGAILVLEDMKYPAEILDAMRGRGTAVLTPSAYAPASLAPLLEREAFICAVGAKPPCSREGGVVGEP